MGDVTRAQPSTPTIDAATYQQALRGIRLQAITLDSMSAWCDREQLNPAETTLDLTSEASERRSGDNYFVFMKYNVVGKTESQEVLRLQALYRLSFETDQPVPEGFFEVYQEVNLPVTLLPYFREFISSTTSRLGIPPFTLPYVVFSPDEDNEEIPPVADEEDGSVQA